MTQNLLVRHEVANYTTWKSHFDAHKNAREKSGIKTKQILRDAANLNDITLIFEVSDIAKANEFANSNELKEIMKKAGVISKPEVYFFPTK